MKTLLSARFLVTALGLILAVLALGGCATAPQIDWNARVGSYTYDQAVVDFGPPDRQARLSDRSQVVEWQTQRGYTETYYPPAWGWGYDGWRHRYYGGYYGGYYGPPMTTYMPGSRLRLVFGPDGKLRSWKKILQ